MKKVGKIMAFSVSRAGDTSKRPRILLILSGVILSRKALKSKLLLVEVIKTHHRTFSFNCSQVC